MQFVCFVALKIVLHLKYPLNHCVCYLVVADQENIKLVPIFADCSFMDMIAIVLSWGTYREDQHHFW